jgi:hypothetical protein
LKHPCMGCFGLPCSPIAILQFFCRRISVLSIPTARWLFLAGAMIAYLLGAVCPLQAQDNKLKVKVCLVSILASQTDEKIDEKLKSIAKEVQKSKPELKLKGFHLANMTCSSLAKEEKWIVDLVEGQKAEITIHQCADKEKCVILKVRAPGRGEITYRTVCGKFLPIVTKYQTKDKKDQLILAIMVKPCQKGKLTSQEK